MEQFQFEWDEAKNLANKRKHGISFEQAIRVFSDPLHTSRSDKTDRGEQRWQTFGVVGGAPLVMVAHTLHEGSQTIIRIISARRATRREQRDYEEQNG